ncbi:Multidrug resistance protein [Clarireedia jacksonii]
MTNLRQSPSAFFTFLGFSFLTTTTLFMFFRSVGAASRSLTQALCPTAIALLVLITYAGFVIPIGNMTFWFRWIHYINPLAYAFESLMINEFARRDFPCSNFVPSGEGYMKVSPRNRMCSVVGATFEADIVAGVDYLRIGFGYDESHMVRNIVALITFMVIFMVAYLVTTEKVLAKKSRGEFLLFKRRHKPQFKRQKHLEIYSGVNIHKHSVDSDPISKIPRQSSIFQWKDICLDMKIEGSERRILDHVDGWIKPGTLTALMGPSGAGKTALLNVLSSRSNSEIVSGETYLDGCLCDQSFQRKVGFIQQQDIHLATTTVREALHFSALLRQSSKIVKKEKFAYVEEIIKLLDMEVYADAVIGMPGEGLNIEQRKRLSIGVELASKPKLLLFFDEVTSGLDSVTSWAFLELLQKLAAHGQAVLCTVSQPNSSFLELFDRVLLLGPGGKPVYFGEVGQSCEIVKKYFEENGAALFLGFSFYKELNSLEDLQNQIFGVFMLLTLGFGLVLQVFPNLLMQRVLFESREQPAKFYSWQSFIVGSILAELPWNTLAALLIFLCWYYPTGMYHNATGGSTRMILEKNGLMIVLFWEYLMYASTFGQLMQVDLELAETAAKLSYVVFLLLLMFCGIIIVPTAQPLVWMLLHHLSPFTYLVDGILSVGLAGVTVQCSDLELLHFEPVAKSTCGSYMASYIRNVGGYLVNPSATSNCAFCAIKDSKEFIASTTMSYTHRWQNVGILGVYISFNVIMTLFVYWLVRVPKNWRRNPKQQDQRQTNLRREDEVGGSSQSEDSHIKQGRRKEDNSHAKRSGNSEDIELAQL